MARTRRRAELQREGQVRCRFCGGFYDPTLPECPNCGYQTEENQSYTTDWKTIGTEDCAGGFGGPKSPIQIAANWLGGMLVGLLIVVAVVNVGKSLMTTDKTAKAVPVAAVSSAAPAEVNTQGSESEPAEPEKTQKAGQADKKTVTLPEEIVLNYTDLTMQAKEELTLEPTIEPEEWDGTLEWSTSDQYVAWVDQKGKVTCLGGGNCTITVSAGRVKQECKVLCNGAPANHAMVDDWVKQQTKSKDEKKQDDQEKDAPLTLNISDMTLMRPGDAYNLIADGGGGLYTWSSSNPAVAEVDDGGGVTAVSRGSTVITCTIANGKTAECRIHVTYG